MRHRWSHVIATTATTLAAVLMMGTLAAAGATTKPKVGGAVTIVTVNLTWPGLDPATDTSASLDATILNSIYGQLFQQLPSNGSVVGDLATGYKFTNANLTMSIFLRHNVKFTDGSPLTAQSVATNIQRDLVPANACTCLSNFSDVTSVSTAGTYTVVLNLAQPDASLLLAFISSGPNWIASPTALASESEATYAQNPVGAGPYKVQSNQASAQLVLSKNTGYWEKGHPYLDTITFLPSASDTSAFAALQSGQAQITTTISTVSIIQQARSEFQVPLKAGTTQMGIEFNTLQPPFNNLLAREAIAYATNPVQILQTVSPNFGSVVQSQSAPGDGPFYEKTVPGYRKYNLAKAKQLVQQVGGLNITLETATVASFVLGAQALQNQWAQAGITTTVAPLALAVSTANFVSGKWQAFFTDAGAADPDLGVQSFPVRFQSGGKFSCCSDQTLNQLIAESEAYVKPAVREHVVKEIYAYIAKNAYEVPVFQTPTAIEASKQLIPLGPVETPAGTLQLENVAYK